MKNINGKLSNTFFTGLNSQIITHICSQVDIDIYQKLLSQIKTQIIPLRLNNK
jgi:hypothetical protein